MTIQTDATSRAVGTRDRLSLLVTKRVELLQRTREASATTAVLAHLRRNVAATPGVDPRIWGMTVAEVSPTAHRDEATDEEWAVHGALTLYAVHQQSQPANVHRRGIGLGNAVARLDQTRGAAGSETSPLRRRFNAVLTADSTVEILHHLRGLVNQLRSGGVPLDYGRLAADLWAFQDRQRRDAVRRRWARELYRLVPTAGSNSANPDDAETTEEQQ